MLLIRPCQMSDLDDLMVLSRAVGRGMTSMPADEAAWLSKIEATTRSFSAQGAEDAMGTYFMVLEDPASGRVVGTTAIYTGIGLDRPFYSYKVSTLVSSSSDLAVTRQARVLSMVNDYTGATEVGSLFVLPEYRKPGVGQFLSRARFLTMADFPERFGETVMAELRGWQDENGNSPLWQHLGSQFFGIEFQDAVNTEALKGTQFISDLMPKYPIYVDLLPPEAREVIGRCHVEGIGAMKLLEWEGFRFERVVDIFDGGPQVSTQRKNIRTICESHVVTFELGMPGDRAKDALVSTDSLENFRTAWAKIDTRSDSIAVMDQAVFDALKIKPGHQGRIWTKE